MWKWSYCYMWWRGALLLVLLVDLFFSSCFSDEYSYNMLFNSLIDYIIFLYLFISMLHSNLLYTTIFEIYCKLILYAIYIGHIENSSRRNTDNYAGNST